MSTNPEPGMPSEGTVHEHPTSQRAELSPERGSTGGGLGEDLVIVAGLWLAISPWVMGFGGGGAQVNALIIGLAIAVFGALSMSGLSSFAFLRGVTAVLGAWMIAAPFALAATTTAMGTTELISDVVCGAVVFLVSLGLVAGGGRGGFPIRVHVGRGHAAS